MLQRLALPCVVALAIVLLGCAPSSAPSGSDPQASTAAASPTTVQPTSGGVPSPVRVLVVGDSNSTGFSGTFDRGLAEGTAWAAQLPAERFPVAGGWAVDGATTGAMREGVLAQQRPADRLLVMAGTNDLAQSVPFQSVADNIRAIVAAVGVRNVTILTVAPSDTAPDATSALNAALIDLAASEGWDAADPWSALRAADGRWLDPYRTDGVHTSAAGYAVVGRAVADHLAGLPD